MHVVTQKYAEFSGRARRAEYWNFLLVQIGLSIIPYALGMIGAAMEFGFLSVVGFVIYGIIALALVVPGLGVSVRRLHDTGRSGWWLLISLVPVVGAIAMIYFLVSDGHRGQNQYGPDPKASVNDPIDHFHQQRA